MNTLREWNINNRILFSTNLHILGNIKSFWVFHSLSGFSITKSEPNNPQPNKWYLPLRKLTCFLKRDSFKRRFHLPTIHFQGIWTVGFQAEKTSYLLGILAPWKPKKIPTLHPPTRPGGVPRCPPNNVTSKRCISAANLLGSRWISHRLEIPKTSNPVAPPPKKRYTRFSRHL